MGSNEKSAMKLKYRQGWNENRRLRTATKTAAIFKYHPDQSNGKDIGKKHWGGFCNFRCRRFQRYAESHNCRIHVIIHSLIRKLEPTDLLGKFNPKQGQPNKKKQAGCEPTRHSSIPPTNTLNLLLVGCPFKRHILASLAFITIKRC